MCLAIFKHQNIVDYFDFGLIIDKIVCYCQAKIVKFQAKIV